jgi:hypothetical protein
MKVRMKSNPEMEFWSGEFNTHALNEVIGYGEEFGADLFFIKNLDVFIETSGDDGMQIGWKDLGQAFKDHDVICDNYNTRFFEPPDKESRKRGYTLH